MRISTRPEPTETESLTLLAKAYESLGYRVTKAPSPEDLPDFLKGFRPDLIARKADESLIIEIRRGDNTKPQLYWRQLEKTLNKHPDWKLQLVDPYSWDAYPNTKPSDIDTIRTWIESAQIFLNQNQIDLAIVTAFSALEAAMRRIASRASLTRDRVFVPVLIAGLLEIGYFDLEEVELLRKMMDKRNAIVHGFMSEGDLIELNNVKKLIAIAKELARQL